MVWASRPSHSLRGSPRGTRKLNLSGEGTYLHGNSICPDFVTHAHPENAEVVCRGHEPHILVDKCEHNRDRPRWNIVEQRPRDRRGLCDEKREEGD